MAQLCAAATNKRKQLDASRITSDYLAAGGATTWPGRNAQPLGLAMDWYVAFPSRQTVVKKLTSSQVNLWPWQTAIQASTIETKAAYSLEDLGTTAYTIGRAKQDLLKMSDYLSCAQVPS